MSFEFIQAGIIDVNTLVDSTPRTSLTISTSPATPTAAQVKG
jgi:hypothetical protein